MNETTINKKFKVIPFITTIPPNSTVLSFHYCIWLFKSILKLIYANIIKLTVTTMRRVAGQKNPNPHSLVFPLSSEMLFYCEARKTIRFCYVLPAKWFGSGWPKTQRTSICFYELQLQYCNNGLCIVYWTITNMCRLLGSLLMSWKSLFTNLIIKGASSVKRSYHKLLLFATLLPPLSSSYLLWSLPLNLNQPYFRV